MLRLFLSIIFILYIQNLCLAFEFNIKQVEINEGEFRLDTKTKVVVTKEFLEEGKIVAQMIKDIVDFRNRVFTGELEVVDQVSSRNLKHNITILDFETAFNSHLLKDNDIKLNHISNEDYLIRVYSDEILLLITSKRAFGCLLSTFKELLLMSHITIVGSKVYLSLPVGKIYDWPTFAMRGLHITLFDTLDFERIKRVIDAAADNRFNTIFFTVNNGIKYATHPEISKSNALSKAQLKELVEYAKQKQMKVIPEINLLSHQEWLLYPAYKNLMLSNQQDKNNLTYDLRKGEVYEIVFDLIDEIIEIFSPEYIHIGHDEAFGLRMFDEPKSYNMFSKSVIDVYNYIKKKNKNIKVMMWADMLVKEHNGGEKNIYKALDLIPKDIILIIWYLPKDDDAIVKEVMSHGFRVIISVFKNETKMKKYADLAKRILPEPKGIIATTWYYLPWNRMEMLDRLIYIAGRNFW